MPCRRPRRCSFFPIDGIDKLRANGGYIQFRVGKIKTIFHWADARKTIKPHRQLLQCYVHAANGRRDILGDCRVFAEATARQ